ncbi:MAG: LytR C-terminal domain-containing protein [Nocardioidaceae bacterium]
MALPSAVTIGSLVVVVAAGVGFAATSSADEGSAPHHAAHQAKPTPSAGTPASTPKQGKSDETKKHSQHRSKTDRRDDPDVVPKVSVDVYNNSGITGLAGEKSALLQGAGWTVTATDNWYGDIPDNTVYYPPKLKDAATKLAKVLHIDRVHPAVSPMQFDRLTVIFTHS